MIRLLIVIGLTAVLAVPASTAGTEAAPTPAVAADRAEPPAGKVAFGAFVSGMTARPGRLARYEEMIGRRTDIASYYYGFGDVFPGAVERTMADGGRRAVLVSWDPGNTRFTQWSSGRHDAYLDQIIAAANNYPYDLYVRPWPEMNGDWSLFQPTASGSSPNGGTYSEFIAAWRHVVTYVRQGGAANIKWVFNPTADVYRETTPVGRIWPGEAYVDVLGMDGFNWGRDSSWGTWRSFPSIFAAQYKRLTGLHRTAPVWICEFATKEPLVDDGAPAAPGRDKADWLTRALGYNGFPRLKALIHFDIRKERDWRIGSSTRALRRTRAALGSARFSW